MVRPFGICATDSKQISRSLCLLMIAALLTGCLGRGTRPTQIELDLTGFLPAEWQPVRELIEVNIDDDSAVEYLMLFLYDQRNGDGPVGALILDPQSESIVTETGERVVGRPSSFPNPYPVLPSYWRGAGQGFVAPPGQSESVTVHQVASGEGAAADTLILRGGNSYLTFVWWRNVIDGYGVSQLYAPGGFEGIDWTTWQGTPQPILSVTGVTPRNDRSLICRRTRYDRGEPATIDPEDIHQAVEYRATDLGLDFCAGAPAHPFYPEGVVLALLRNPDQRTTLLAPELRADSAAQAQLAEIIGQAGPVHVDEVLGYQDVVVLAQEVEPKTTVCAQVRVDGNGEGGQSEPRWLLFTLIHEPPLLEPPTPDRLYVANVSAIPAPGDGTMLQCSQLIDQ
jgi:hypothetical protein